MNQTVWDLSPVLGQGTPSEIQTERARVERETKKFTDRWKEREDYLHDPAVLAEALKDYESWQATVGDNATEGYFFSLKNSLDQTDPEIKAKLTQATEFEKQIENATRFFELKIAKIPVGDQQRFLDDQRLVDYKHFLEKLFAEGAHLLSEPEEKILSLTSQTAYDNWVRMTEEFLSREERAVLSEAGKTVTLPFAGILGLIDSQQKPVRDAAAAALNSIFVQHVDVAEHEINSVLLDKKINDELRHFASPQESRFLVDDVSPQMVLNLVAAVSGQYALPAKFYELKARLFNVPKLAYHERNVPYGQAEKPYSFEDSAELVLSVFGELHPRFREIVQSFLDHGQIDVTPKKGKHGGAYCSHSLKTLPTFVLLNHNNRLRDVTTLAHELGHGINNELMRATQNSLNFGTPTSTAEVASTFMEDFVLERLLAQADKELQLQLLLTKLGDEVGTIFRQVAFYQFESELHAEFRRRGRLTKEEIGKLFQKHMAEYMGTFVEQSAGSENYWVYVGHFRYYFYVYSYASGLLVSKALQNLVHSDPQQITQVIEFLSAGQSAAPQQIFAKLGIDIADEHFWQRGLTEFANNLSRAWKLAEELGKI